MLFPADPERVTLGEVTAAFPLRATSSFHWRFQVTVDKSPVYLDLVNPADTVPLAGANIIAKVLRLGAYGARLRAVW
jgi:hypothetical protein